MKKTDCDTCKHGNRYYAQNKDGQLIKKDWTIHTGETPKEMYKDQFWTYFVCNKNTFSITSPCPKYAINMISKVTK